MVLAQRPDAQRLDIIRKAAGVDRRIGQGSPGHHLGRFICLNCPDDRHVPPYRPLRLQIHIQEHLAANPGHVVKFYCYDHGDLEDEWREVASLPAPQAIPAIVPAPSRELASTVAPLAVVAALEVLRQAGIVDDPQVTPRQLLLNHSEGETLEAIRAQPGQTIREVAAAMGLSVSAVKDRVRFLGYGGHVRAEGRGTRDDPRRHFPAHSLPFAYAHPREQVRW